MSEAILVALITGGLSLVGVVVTCIATAKKNEAALRVSQAVTDTKIDELTREVREAPQDSKSVEPGATVRSGAGRATAKKA